MTTADDLGYDDDEQAPDPQAAAKAASEAAFAERKAKREAEREELAELRKFKAQAEREKAFTAAKDDLKADGPLDVFLRSYTGEPTADAIREAVGKDPYFADKITFPQDPRDAAAQEQARNAAAMATGTTPGTGMLDGPTVRGWDDDRKRAFRADHPDLWAQMLKDPNAKIPAPAG